MTSLVTPLLTSLLLATSAPCPKVERVGPCPMAEAAHCKRDKATQQMVPDLEPCEGARVPVPILETLMRSEDRVPLLEQELRFEREQREQDAILAQKKLEAADQQSYELKRTCRATAEKCAPDDTSLLIGVSVGGGVVMLVAGILIGMGVSGGL